MLMLRVSQQVCMDIGDDDNDADADADRQFVE